MFNRDSKNDPHLLMEIGNLLCDMHEADRTSDEYAKMLNHLTKLYALKDDKSKRSASADTKFTVLGNLAAVALIVGHERANVITSKALNFIKMAR